MCVFIRVHVDVCAFVPHDTGNVTMRGTGHVRASADADPLYVILLVLTLFM